MNLTRTSTVDQALQGLTRTAALTPAGANALRELIAQVERYPATALVSSIASSVRLKWLISGWACELRVLPDGRRQIFSFVLPGDVLVSRPVNATPCSVMAITSLECVDLSQTLTRARDADRAEIWRAMNHVLSLTHERRYEDIIRLGRRSAIERLADLLIELHDRLDILGMVEHRSFYLPVTQKDLADALGLSAVQVNRSLRALRLRNLAVFRFGRVSGFDRSGLLGVCGG
ncbi:MAG: transcriptional regulator, family [Caulobacteraceae bacterium]|nr:transcriptional regulator, family [Caulobacteraceae bacterium]